MAAEDIGVEDEDVGEVTAGCYKPGFSTVSWPRSNSTQREKDGEHRLWILSNRWEIAKDEGR